MSQNDFYLEAQIKNFQEKYSLNVSNINGNEMFEIFSNYVAIYENIGNYDNNYNGFVKVGQTQDVDGIIFAYDNELISDKECLKDRLKKKEDAEIKVIFTQAKTGSIDFSKLDGLHRFILDFRDQEKSLENYNLDKNSKSNINKILEIRKEIFELSKRVHINLKEIAYFFTKKPYNTEQNEDNPTISLYKKGEIKLNILGQDEIIQKTKDIDGNFRIPPVKIEKKVEIDNCLIGVIKFSEFKKIICDENGEGVLRELIFEDNIREYQGETSVNKEIAETLKNKIDDFPLLNNGIAIVVKDYNQNKNDQFEIKAPKIINGCQTTNTLYNNKDIDGIDDLLIPFKLIIINDGNEDKKNDITIASNSQNSIDEYLRVCVNEANKMLEDFYENKNTPVQFYYERLKGKHRKKKQESIISLQEQAKCYISTFLESPNLASDRGKKSITEQTEKGEIFHENHEEIKYYLAYYLYFTLNNSGIEFKYGDRYHILLCFYKILTSSQITTEIIGIEKFPPNEKSTPKIDKQCDAVINWVDDEKNKNRLNEILEFSTNRVSKYLHNKSRSSIKHNSKIKEISKKFNLDNAQ